MLRFCLLDVSTLTICLFQSFKERLLLPIEATWWAICAALFRCLQHPFWLGLQRYESFFYSASKKRKNLLFSFCFTYYCFRLKRCAKVTEKFDFQNLNGEIFKPLVFLSIILPASIRLAFSINYLRINLLLSTLHMPCFIWECKGNTFFGISKFEEKKFYFSYYSFGDSNEPFYVTGCKGMLRIWD
jgi:hypothetical protein